MKKTECKGKLFNYLGHFSQQKYLDQGHNYTPFNEGESFDNLTSLDAQDKASPGSSNYIELAKEKNKSSKSSNKSGKIVDSESKGPGDSFNKKILGSFKYED